MCANEFFRSSAFFLQKSCFTQLGILMHLFVTRDAIQLPGVLVVNRIVSHPQFEGYKDSAGKHSPEAAGHGSRGSISDSQCYRKKRPADERRKQAIEEGSQIERSGREAAEQLENDRQEKRVDRRQPSRGPCRLVKHATESLPLRQRRSYAPNLILKWDRSQRFRWNLMCFIK